jgi:hypothetical protein
MKPAIAQMMWPRPVTYRRIAQADHGGHAAGTNDAPVRRLVRRYEQQGPIGLISRLRDRPSNRRLKTPAADHAFGILRSEYTDLGST